MNFSHNSRLQSQQTNAREVSLKWFWKRETRVVLRINTFLELLDFFALQGKPTQIFYQVLLEHQQ